MLRRILVLAALLPAITSTGCGPRVGPAYANFEHTHTLKYQTRLDPEPEPLPASAPVELITVDRLPEGLRKRRATQGIVADPRDPLNKRKMRRVTYSAIEASRSYPSVTEPHKVVGEVTVKLKIRYLGFRADDEEIDAEWTEAMRHAADAARDVAREHGANAVIPVRTTMKDGSNWWRQPRRDAICRDRGKRCVKHAVKFNLVRTSDAERKLPSAAELFELHARKGYRSLPPRRMKNGKLTLPVKRHHCYQLVVALEDDAKWPEGPHLLSAQSLGRYDKRFSLDGIFHRSLHLRGFGCSAKTTNHDPKLVAYAGAVAKTDNKTDPAAFEGVSFQLLERRMEPAEATRFFCGQCKKVAQRCGYRKSCQDLRRCLQRRQQPVNSCKRILGLH